MDRDPALGKTVRDFIEIIFLVLGWMLLFLVVPHSIDGDGPARYEAIQRLVEQGRLSSIAYSLIGPLLSSPLLLLGKWIRTPEWWVARFNTILFGLGAVLIHQLLRHSMSPRLIRRFLLLTMLASMMPHELLGYGAETFNAVSVAAGLAAWIAGRWIFGSVLLSLGVANMPGTAIGLALTMVAWAWCEKKVRAAVPVLLTGLLFGMENWVRRGSPLLTGYEGASGGPHPMLPYADRPGFGYPLFFGILSFLFSFGKGLLFFAPGLFLPLGNTAISPVIKSLHRYSVVYLVGLVLTYGQWSFWFGGVAWGPRFLIFASFPAALVLAVRLGASEVSLINNTFTFLALVLSFWVGFTGSIFGMEGQEACVVNDYINAPYCWYVPEWSVLWHRLVDRRALSAGEWAVALFYIAVFFYYCLPLMRTISSQLYRKIHLSIVAFINRPGWRF